jgi:hypothetical protein
MDRLERQKVMQRARATLAQIEHTKAEMRFRAECEAHLRILFRDRYGRSPTDEEDECWRFTPEGELAVQQVLDALEKTGRFKVVSHRKSAWPIGEYWCGVKVR